jgi:hypothetical protein
MTRRKREAPERNNRAKLELFVRLVGVHDTSFLTQFVSCCLAPPTSGEGPDGALGLAALEDEIAGTRPVAVGQIPRAN